MRRLCFTRISNSPLAADTVGANLGVWAENGQEHHVSVGSNVGIKRRNQQCTKISFRLRPKVKFRTYAGHENDIHSNFPTHVKGQI